MVNAPMSEELDNCIPAGREEPAMVRDSQRQKVYDAEHDAFDKNKTEGMSLEEIEALVQKVWSGKRVQAKYRRATTRRIPEVTDGRSRRTACFDPGLFEDELKFPRWSRSKWIVLHELAHALTFNRSQAWHGWEFCECYLYLVRVYMGRPSEERLKAEFKKRKVRFKEPRKRNMSPEQREAARQRMLAFHAARETAPSR